MPSWGLPWGRGDAALTLATSLEHPLSTESSPQEWKTLTLLLQDFTSLWEGFSKKKCSLFMLSNMRPNITGEEVVVSSVVTAWGLGTCWTWESKSCLSTSLGEACRERKKCLGALGLGFSGVKTKLNGGGNSSPYFPFEQRSLPVSEPTRLPTVPVTSPGSGGETAFAGGRGTTTKVNGGFSALFTWFRWSLLWCKVSRGPTQKYMTGLWAPFSSACLHLPFLPLWPREETALNCCIWGYLSCPELLLLGHGDGKRSSVWLGALLKGAFLSLLSQGSLGQTHLSPFL